MDPEKQLVAPGGNQLISVDGQDGKRQMTNFPGSGVERWFFISSVTQEKGISGDEALDKEIDLAFWHVMEVELMNERTGELETSVRTAFVTHERKVFVFTSDGVYNGLRVLVHAVGLGPYKQGQVVFKVKAGQSRTKRRYYYIEPVRQVAAS